MNTKRRNKMLRFRKIFLLFFLVLIMSLVSSKKVYCSVVINEFMADNKYSIQDSNGDYDDWIEIYNTGDVAIDIGGMYLTDDLDEPTKWQIPDNNPTATTIPAYGFLLIWADNETAEDELHASFKISADGEELGLFETDGSTLIDSVVFGHQYTDISYGRYPDGTDNWQFLVSPTAGYENDEGYLGVVADTEFSVDHGFYDTPFEVAITCATDGATIFYTLDGSMPIPWMNGYEYTAPIDINTTTCLRAVAFKTGWLSYNINTQTYLFLADVITQSPTGSAPGPGWPTGSVNGQMIDYGMDPDVVYDSRYVGLVDDALLAIPTISLVTDLYNLFNPWGGIYVNAREDGDAWERPTSVELINPDDSEGFQIDAGLRIRGGWSRHPDDPKHAFRLFFRNEYGQAKLNYPLFGDEGVDEFEKIDLRTEQNYSWSYYGDVQNTMVREVFSRDIQGRMGQPYTRSRYYHLYINGQYWGIYQTQERSEARYAASYFGGDVEDYDVVKVDGWPGGAYEIMATDGNLDAYANLWQAATAGFSTNAAYYAVQGLNSDGTYDPVGTKLVDIDNLIDYMLGIFYTGDFDAPISWFMSNNGINNFYAIYNRNGQEGWKFFRHDGEHTLFAHVSGFSQSIDRTGPYSAGSWVERFNPQWLHQQLTVNSEYCMRFADRVYKHFFNEGPLVASAAVNTFMARKNQIDSAIIAESARWGDAKVGSPRTRDSHWLPTINSIVNNFFPTRTSVVLGQLRTKGWYPNIDPPEFNQHGGHVSVGFSLTMTNPNGSGTIWYTTDGTDPRLIGGAVNTSHAVAYTGAISLTENTHIKARVLDDSTWSALNEAIYSVIIGSVVDNLRITELMYHPAPANTAQGELDVDENEFEFIELKNIGNETLDLTGVSFTDGIEFTFYDVLLAPGEYVLVVRNEAAFESRYGTSLSSKIAGEYSGKLDNAGENITLVDALGNTVLDFTYDDAWYPSTDGDGYSLVIIDATADPFTWGDKESWRPSSGDRGSPGVVYPQSDFDQDGDVDWADLAVFVASYLKQEGQPGYDARCDFNDDGIVNLKDYATFANEWNPPPPEGLLVQTVSSSQINLTWQDTTDGENGFKIERKTDVTGTYGQIASVGQNVVTYSDSTLKPGTTCYYRVRAYGTSAFGSTYSGYSNEANAATQPNHPPVLDPIPWHSTARVGQLIQFTLSAHDPDGDPLTYMAATLPAGATFNTSTGFFSWTPNYNQAGMNLVVFVVKDPYGLTDGEGGYIQVMNTQEPNHPPVLDPIGFKRIKEDELLEFTLSAHDPDGDVLTYRAVSGPPPGATFNTSTGLFSWRPNYNQAGLYLVVFVVRDPYGGTHGQGGYIQVMNSQ